MCYYDPSSCKKKKKRKEIPTHTETWLDLKDIMLSEMRQSGKDTRCPVPLTGGVGGRGCTTGEGGGRRAEGTGS